MNMKDFNLLTDEEIKEVIAEVLGEATSPPAGGGIQSAATAEEDSEEEGEEQEDTTANTNTTSGDETPDTRGQIGVDQHAAGRVGGGLQDRGDPGIKSSLAYAQQRGVTSAASGDINPSRTKDARGLAQRAAGGVQSALTGKDTVGGGATSNKYGEPGVAAADGNKLGGPDNIDKPEFWTLTDSNWYTGGSSKTAPAAVRRRIQKRYGGIPMSPDHVVNDYIFSRHGLGAGDITSQMANTERKMTLAKIDQLIKTAQKTKGTEDGPDHAEKVLRYLDALLALTIKEDPGGKVPPGKSPEADPEPGPEPEPTPDPEEPEAADDDKRKVGAVNFMMSARGADPDKYPDVSDKDIRELAAAVNDDLNFVAERKSKEMPKTKEFLTKWFNSNKGIQQGLKVAGQSGLSADVAKRALPELAKGANAFKGMMALLVDYLKTTESSVTRDLYQTYKQLFDSASNAVATMKGLDSGGGEEKAPEEPKPEEPQEKEPEEKEKETKKKGPKYILNPSDKAANAKISRLIQRAYESQKSKHPEGSSFENDFAEFINDLGRVKFEKAARVKPLEEIAGAALGNIFALSSGDEVTPQEQGRIRDALAALGAARRKNTGSYRIMQALRKIKIKKKGDSAEAKMLGNMWNSIKRAPKAQKKKQKADATAVSSSSADTGQTSAGFVGDFIQDPPAIAAEGMLSESVINRWKTISGVTRGK